MNTAKCDCGHSVVNHVDSDGMCMRFGCGCKNFNPLVTRQRLRPALLPLSPTAGVYLLDETESGFSCNAVNDALEAAYQIGRKVTYTDEDLLATALSYASNVTVPMHGREFINHLTSFYRHVENYQRTAENVVATPCRKEAVLSLGTEVSYARVDLVELDTGHRVDGRPSNYLSTKKALFSLAEQMDWTAIYAEGVTVLEAI